MGETGHNVYRYSDLVIVVFGIVGNVLVIISILKQKNMLKNNYYFLVLHLAFCDLGVLIIYLLDFIDTFWFGRALYIDSFMYCVLNSVFYVFQVSGLGMMLMISVLRYRATVHPLKPAISRPKVKIVSSFVYTVGFIAGYGPVAPLCWNDFDTVYLTYHWGYIISCYYILPGIFLAVVYSKIVQALFQQNKFMKSLCSNPARREASSSTGNILRLLRNRKVVFICLVTVLCSAIGNIPMTVVLISYMANFHNFISKNIWILYCANVLRVAGTHSANPIIYGLMDKKFLKFWKLRRTTKRWIKRLFNGISNWRIQTFYRLLVESIINREGDLNN